MISIIPSEKEKTMECKNSRDEIIDPICTITLYVAAATALFLTSNVFSEIHADTIG
jgi:hypothetical protein